MALLDPKETEGLNQAGRSLLGLRISAIAETFIFLLILLVVDFAFLDGRRFQEVVPHPFWIIVLLVSVQYGSQAGLFAAVAASAALLLGNIPPLGFGQDLYSYIGDVTRLPVMWVITAVVIGGLQGRRIRRQQELQQELRESEERGRVIAEGFQNLKQHVEGLEELIASESHTFVTAYQAAKAIERKSVGEVLLGIPGLLREVLRPSQFSLFLLNGDVLEGALCEGWEAKESLPRCYDRNSALFQAMVVERRLLCVAVKDDERILGRDGVLACPLISADTAAVFGILKCEKLGFLGLNLRTIQNFQVLCEWIGMAHARARQMEELVVQRLPGRAA